MDRYIYNGPVMLFGKCVADRWEGETIAPTKKKAKSNLIFQYKKQNKLCAGAKIELSGNVILAETKGEK